MLLWGATTHDDDDTKLSWFAALEREGERGIDRGTPEMVAAMLKDLGYQASAIAGFEVRHLRTNYLDPKAWGHAWEITARLAGRVAELPLQGNVAKTTAEDATWEGSPPAGPAEHVLFVDFRDSDLAERAERILGAVARELDFTLSHRGHETAQLLASFGVVDAPDEAQIAKATTVFQELGARTTRP